MFPDSSVIFKQQHLIHYPTVIRSCGPPLYLSVLRYERKHQFFKKLANNICNFKNLTKSLAVRHQIAQFVDWRNGLPVKEDDFSGARLVEFSEFFKSEDCKTEEPFKNCNVLISKHAVIKGTLYNINEAVIKSISSQSEPEFGLIKHILVDKTDIYFVVVILKLHYYDSHSRSYAVMHESSCQFSFIAHADLFDYHPLSLHSCFLNTCIFSHICLRHDLLSTIMLAILTQRAIIKTAKFCVTFAYLFSIFRQTVGSIEGWIFFVFFLRFVVFGLVSCPCP